MSEPIDDRSAALTRSVQAEFRRRMLEEYVPRIEGCVRRLDRDQLWARPNERCNSVGNLLLHLEGNVRQWMLAGVGGDADRRDRDGEFAAAGGTAEHDAAALLTALRDTVTRAVDLADGLSADDLLETRLYQGRYRETGLGAVLHVMEHFSGHAGQIYDRTKQLLGVDLRHYDL